MHGENTELLMTPDTRGEMLPYERLLHDAMLGDATLFAREDMVEAAWTIVDDVLDDRTPVFPYEPKTWGPKEAVRLLGDQGLQV